MIRFIGTLVLLFASGSWTSVTVAREAPDTVTPARLVRCDAQLLMIGDSITQGWEKAGRDVWNKYYAKRHALNLGIGGDETQHVLWRLDHGNVDGLHPKLAVLMIGTNNSTYNTPDQIAAGIRAIVEKLRTKLPETKVLVLAIFPCRPGLHTAKHEVNEAANERIEKLADGRHVFFRDIGPKFLSAEKTLSRKIMPDLLHPSPAGYEIWASAIEPDIARFLGDN